MTNAPTWFFAMTFAHSSKEASEETEIGFVVMQS
jgi:hypothetical protein